MLFYGISRDDEGVVRELLVAQLIGVDGDGVAREVSERYGCGYEQIKDEESDAKEPSEFDAARIRIHEKHL